MSIAPYLPLCVFPFLVVACSGDNPSRGSSTAGGSGGGTFVPTATPCMDAVGTGTNGLIDSLDDGDGFIELTDGRQGDWATFNDGTGEQLPPSPVGACDTNYRFLPSNGKACTSGSGFTDWGAALSILLNWGGCNNCRYDASAYQGIRFTLSGETSLTQLRFAIPIAATQSAEFGGSCTADCFNHYGVIVTPKSEAQVVSVLFTELTQASDWGTQVPWNPQELLSLGWNLTASGTPAADMAFDICVDDVEFV